MAYRLNRYTRFQGPFSMRMGKMVRSLLYANIAVFALQFLIPSDFLRAFFAFWPDRAVLRGHIWQFVTYAFLHAGLFHILFNMLFLYWFGCEIEFKLGPTRFLWFYVGAIVSGAMLHCLFYLNWRVPMVGASGAIMGLVVMYAMFWPDRKILFMLFLPMKMRTFAAFIILLDLYAAASGTGGNVAVFAHLGGAAYGFLYLRFYPAWERFKRRRQRRRDRFIQDRTDRDNVRLDHVLDKVHERGMHTLTRAEQRFLKRMSEAKRRT